MTPQDLLLCKSEADFVSETALGEYADDKADTTQDDTSDPKRLIPALRRERVKTQVASNLSQDIFNAMDRIESDPMQVHTGSSRWMIPYADLLTLLLGMFMLLYAIASVDKHHVSEQKQKLETQLVRLQEKLKAPPGMPSQKTSESISKALKQRLGQTQGISVSQQATGLVISLSDKILFAPGQATLDTTAQARLDQITEILKQYPGDIRVEGHTDNSPIATSAYPSNWELSTARATQIIRYWVGKHRLNARRLSAAGYGEFHPIAENSSIEGKQKNRRVDIVILNH